jgi:hypothetical protein
MVEAEGESLGALLTQEAISQLEAKVLGSPTEGGERDATWAHDVCALTRDLHIDVWDYAPPKDTVRNRVIPGLVLAEDAVRKVPRSDEHPTDRYADNISARVENLGRYVRGEASAFDPGEPHPSKAPAV